MLRHPLQISQVSILPGRLSHHGLAGVRLGRWTKDALELRPVVEEDGQRCMWQYPVRSHPIKNIIPLPGRGLEMGQPPAAEGGVQRLARREADEACAVGPDGALCVVELNLPGRSASDQLRRFVPRRGVSQVAAGAQQPERGVIHAGEPAVVVHAAARGGICVRYDIKADKRGKTYLSPRRDKNWGRSR